MASGEDPNAWLGLLKWSLSHQDGTEPSEARPMADEDRAWLEKVVTEGVRDDFKAMTEIYSRLCTYLDLAATNSPPPLHRCTPGEQASGTTSTDQSSTPPVASGGLPAAGTGIVNISTGAATDFVPPAAAAPPAHASAAQGTGVPPEAAPGAAPAAASGGGALSTFIAAAPSFSSPSSAGLPEAGSAAADGAGTGGGAGGGGGDGTTEGLAALEEGLLNDLDELQEIVEQIDAASTFAKIGGFGRLIALVAPARRPEKLRLRAASVIATLTKNNPPAQAAFSSSGGHRALIEAVSAAQPADTTSAPASMAAALSLPLQRAILHALSSSVMGLAPVEDALCLEPGFQGFLARALSQDGEGEGTAVGGDGVGEGAAAAVALAVREEESCKLRSKAAFVLKALISAPEASRGRAEALWPAVLGLLAVLEVLAAREAGREDDPAAARETCIEALLAAARGLDGDRVVRDLGARVSRVANRRCQALFEARGAGAGRGGGQEEGLDSSSAEFELGLWSEWDALTGPAQ